MLRIHLIVHGKSRKAATAHALLLKAFEAQKATVVSHLTTHSKHATELASTLASLCDVLVVLGGDGTLHETVKGMLSNQRNADQLPALALWPCGSGNDFSRNFQKPSSPHDFVEKVLSQKFISIDAALLRHSPDQTDVMINAADAGLGPLVVQKVATKPTQWNGALKFGLSILQAFATYRPTQLRVHCDKQHYSGKALTVVVANGRFFGSGIGIAPQASVSDGLLDVTVVGEVSMLEYLRYLPALKRGERIDHPQIRYWQGTHVTIDGEGLMESDGELSCSLPVTVELLPKALRWIH